MDSTHRNPITVFCVDDHAGFRDAVREVIAASRGFVLVGEASSGVDALVSVPRLAPDLLLIDVHMPGMSGFEAAARLTRDDADQFIVLMSADRVRVPRGLVDGDREWTVIEKSELCPRRLLELWNHRRTPARS